MKWLSKTSLVVSIVLTGSCGGNQSREGRYESSAPSTSYSSTEHLKLADAPKSSESTVNMIQADQMYLISLYHTEKTPGSLNWTPFYGDRSSLQAAGAIPFPNFHGTHSYAPNLFTNLSANAALKNSGHNSFCAGNPTYADCPQDNLCKRILSDLGSSANSIDDLYLYLTGETISADARSKLSNISNHAKASGDKNASELVCFAIMQSARFLTY